MPGSASAPVRPAEPEVLGHGRGKRDLTDALDPLVQAVPEGKRRLTGYLLLALLAHVALFWGVQLTYPESTRQPPPRVRAMLALPQRESTLYDIETRDRAFWNRLHDPSMLILPQDQLDADLVALRAPRPGETVPASDAALASPLQPVELRQDGTELPTALLPLERRAASQLLPRPQAFIYPDLAPVAADAASQLRLTGPLASRRWVLEPKLPSPATEVLPPRGTTLLRVGADASGRVVHVLVVESSGNTSIDLLGLEAVRAGRFAPQQANAPAEPARQKLAADGDAIAFQSRTWPAPLKGDAHPTATSAPAPAAAFRRRSSGHHLTWGEAKIHWRLASPVQEQATAPSPRKAGPKPPRAR